MAVELEKPLGQMEIAAFATVVQLLCAVFSLKCEALVGLSTQCRCLCLQLLCSGFSCLAGSKKAALGKVRRWKMERVLFW